MYRQGVCILKANNSTKHILNGIFFQAYESNQPKDK
jgi:hypothetical protein